MTGVFFFPGEPDAVKTVVELGERYGYGNMINRLKDAWSAKLQASEYAMTPQEADRAAQHICAWCDVDTRTGKKVKR